MQSFGIFGAKRNHEITEGQKFDLLSQRLTSLGGFSLLIPPKYVLYFHTRISSPISKKRCVVYSSCVDKFSSIPITNDRDKYVSRHRRFSGARGRKQPLARQHFLSSPGWRKKLVDDGTRCRASKIKTHS